MYTEYPFRFSFSVCTDSWNWGWPRDRAGTSIAWTKVLDSISSTTKTKTNSVVLIYHFSLQIGHLSYHLGALRPCHMRANGDKFIDNIASRLQPLLGLEGWWLNLIYSAFEVLISGGQLGVSPGFPVVVLRKASLFWVTGAWKMIMAVGCPEPFKEFKVIIIKLLSR